MQTSIRRFLLGVATAATVIVADASIAMAQLVQSDVDAQPGGTQTTQLVSSSTEVRRAVAGLLIVALVATVLGIMYWHKTGQEARERHARRFGGRHGGGGEPLSGIDPMSVQGSTLVRTQRSVPMPQGASPQLPPTRPHSVYSDPPQARVQRQPQRARMQPVPSRSVMQRFAPPEPARVHTGGHRLPPHMLQGR